MAGLKEIVSALNLPHLIYLTDTVLDFSCCLAG
jgi:hypothetical protein